MKLALLAWRYLWARPLVAVLNLVLLSLGLASMTFVILTGEQVEQAVQRDLAGIDLVVGAKGSPMQLILSGVFHLDSPTGNIPLGSVKLLRDHPLVARVVPLSLGDSLHGFRIFGTTPEYLDLYGGRVDQGRAWKAPLEAVLGSDAAAELKLRPGDTFAGAHGLGMGGDEHADSRYTVVGTLARTGTVLDRLVVTSTESVWAVHAHNGAPSSAGGQAADDHDHDEAHDGDHDEADDTAREVTLLLVSYRSPIAAVSLPRWVNAQPALQSAAPAFETARLMKMVGAGTEVLRGFGIVLLAAAGLSVFIGLYHAVRERQADLAMMRMLGAPPRRVATLVVAEALWLALLGIIIGVVAGHAVTHLLGGYLQTERSLSLTGAWVSPWEAVVPAAAVLLALLSAALPAIRAFRLDVTKLLQAH